MMKCCERVMNYFSRHVMINSIAHTVGGFGLALLLQHYIQGNAFLPPLVGWLSVALSAAAHIMACLS